MKKRKSKVLSLSEKLKTLFSTPPQRGALSGPEKTCLEFVISIFNSPTVNDASRCLTLLSRAEIPTNPEPTPAFSWICEILVQFMLCLGTASVSRHAAKALQHFSNCFGDKWSFFTPLFLKIVTNLVSAENFPQPGTLSRLSHVFRTPMFTTFLVPTFVDPKIDLFHKLIELTRAHSIKHKLYEEDMSLLSETFHILLDYFRHMGDNPTHTSAVTPKNASEFVKLFVHFLTINSFTLDSKFVLGLLTIKALWVSLEQRESSLLSFFKEKILLGDFFGRSSNDGVPLLALLCSIVNFDEPFVLSRGFYDDLFDSVFVKLFEVINLTQLNHLYFLSKAFVSIIRRFHLHLTKTPPKNTGDLTEKILRPLLTRIILMNFGCYVRNIFGFTKLAFKTFVRICHDLNLELLTTFKGEMSHYFASRNWDDRGKDMYVIINSFLEAGEARNDLQKLMECLPSNLIRFIASNICRETSISARTFYCIGSRLFSDNGMPHFVDKVVSEVYSVLLECSEVQRSRIVLYIVPKIYEVSMQGVLWLLKKLEDSQSAVKLELIVAISHFLKSKRGRIDDPKLMQLLESCFSMSDEDVKLNAIEIIAIQKKATTMLTDVQMKMILKFMRMTVRNLRGGYRSKVISTFHNFFQNTSCLVDFLHRKKSDQQTTQMVQFLVNLKRVLLGNIYPGITHEKLIAVIALYEMMLDNFAGSPIAGQLDLYRFNGHPVASSFMNCVLDCWDRVRIMICKLLMKFPEEEMAFLMDGHNVVLTANALLKSLKLRKADAGALIFRVLQKKCPVDKQLKCIDDALVFTALEGSNGAGREFRFVCEIQNLLNERIKRFESQTEGEKFSMVGVLLLLRYFFEDESFAENVKSDNASEWKRVISEIVEKFQTIVKFIIEILATKRGDQIEGLETSEEEQPENFTDLTSKGHALVVTCWLCVREISELIGVIVSRDLPFHFAAEDFHCFIDLFVDILLSCKHNGAYNKAHLGLKLVMNKLLNCREDDLNRIPKQWLVKLISYLEKGDRQITFMRRSAGLTFAFLSILRNKNNVVFLDLIPFTLEKLSAFCDESHPKYSERAHIHSLNILKFLFRDSLVGNESLPFIERCFLATLRGFNSKNWMIKNSSMMCYVSLVQRCVGGNKANVKTDVYTSVFFGRFPKLNAFIVKALENVKGENDNNLFPILLLLSKLNHLKDNSVLKILESDTFVGHSTYQIREMTTKLLVDRSLYLLDDVVFDFEKYRHSNNLFHGKMLKLFHFLKRFKVTIDRNLRKLNDQEEKTLRSLIEGLSSLMGKHWTNFVLLRSYLKCVMLISELGLDIGEPSTSLMKDFAMKVVFLETKRDHGLVGHYLLEKTVTKLCLRLNLFNDEDVVRVVMNESVSKHVKIEVFKNVDYIASLEKHVGQLLTLFERESIQLLQWFLRYLVRHHGKMEKHVLSFDSILTILKNSSNLKIKGHCLRILGFLVDKDTSDALFNRWLTLLKEYSKDESPFHLRQSCMKSLFPLKTDFSIKRRFIVWKNVLKLLQDSNESIRCLTRLSLPFATTLSEYDVIVETFKRLQREFGDMFVEYCVCEVLLNEDPEYKSEDVHEENLFGKDEINLFDDLLFRVKLVQSIISKRSIDLSSPAMVTPVLQKMRESVKRFTEWFGQQKTSDRIGGRTFGIIGNDASNPIVFLNSYKILVAMAMVNWGSSTEKKFESVKGECQRFLKEVEPFCKVDPHLKEVFEMVHDPDDLVLQQ